MRGRDSAREGSGDERIINPESETQEYLKAVLDAEWRRDVSEPESE